MTQALSSPLNRQTLRGKSSADEIEVEGDEDDEEGEESVLPLTVRRQSVRLEIRGRKKVEDASEGNYLTYSKVKIVPYDGIFE